LPPAARNLFEKRFLDFPKLLIIKSFWGIKKGDRPGNPLLHYSKIKITEKGLTFILKVW